MNHINHTTEIKVFEEKSSIKKKKKEDRKKNIETSEHKQGEKILQELSY